MVITMKSIKQLISSTTVIQKSEFINYLIPIKTIEEATTEYKKIVKKHPNATHHCYAYIVGQSQEQQKYNDDGEPSRTAGYPMLDVLLKNNITDILCVTVRYFGGIKLGAGGLVRAYSNSVSLSLEKAEFATLNQFMIVTINIPFDEIGHVEKLLRDHFNLIKVSYDDNVHYTVEIEESDFSKTKTMVIDRTRGKATFEHLKTISKYL
jgi:uncharacterized YigZ family protein